MLKRGYALVRDNAGRPLRSAGAVSSGMKLDIEMSDGRVRATAGATFAAPDRPVVPFRRRRVKSSDEGQGNLFGS